MSNMDLYNKVRTVPDEAKKTIAAGRLKGFTDVNPMWRIKTLTEQFGPAGIGWYTEITRQAIVEGANSEKAAFVDINLYIKNNDEWSKPIFGTGGSSFVSKEKSGLYTSDEAFKMAYTDALSIACKALGIGADVYYQKDRTKYDQPENSPNRKPEAESKKILVTDEEVAAMLSLADKKGVPTSVLTNEMSSKFGKTQFSALMSNEYDYLIKRLNATQDPKEHK